MIPKAEFTDVVRDVSGGNFKVPQSAFQESGNLAVIDQGREFVGGYTDDMAYAFRSASLPVIVFGDHTKAVKYIDFPFAMGADGVKVLKPSARCDAKYLYHYLRYAKIPDAGYSRHYKFLKELQIPLPALVEQRRIAAILDKVDALRAKRREAIVKLDQMLQSVFLDMFGGPDDMQKWERVPLGEVASTSSGGTPDRSVAEYYGGGIPWVKSGEVVAGEVASTEESITPLGIANSAAKLVSAGTVLLAMYGATAGAVAMLKVEAATNQAVCAIKTGDRLNPLFLMRFLKAIAPSLVAKAVGGAQPNLNQGLIRAVLVPVPPMELQEKFADVVSNVSRHRLRLVEALQSTETLFSSLQGRAFAQGL